MRIVILSSSLYSETAAAMTARLAQTGHIPAGILALRTWHRSTILRKVAQWGPRRAATYARTKLLRPPAQPGHAQLENPHLLPLLEHNGKIFRTLREAADAYRIPVTVCNDQNSPNSLAALKQRSPDLLIYAGGNILRRPFLQIPRLGVLNAHLGLLPEVRGMSSPEWSLLQNISPGITIHYVDAGIDTGPILQRCEMPDPSRSNSLADLRHRLIAFGVEKMVDVVDALDRGTISATPQAELERDNQFFVMHEWLQARAAEHLATAHSLSSPDALRG